MKSKTVILSSAGLKNIIINDKDKENEFYFIIGKEEIRMNKIFAEFLSPIVSHLHLSDPTIDKYSINDVIKTYEMKIKEMNLSNIENNIIKFLKTLSFGQPISIDENEIIDLKLLSIFLGNEELYDLIEQINPIKNDNENELEETIKKQIDDFLIEIQLYEEIQGNRNSFNYKKQIEYLSSHFSKIDKQKLIKLNKSIIYEIMSNEKLKVSNEDELYDFIECINFEQNEDNQNLYSEKFDKLYFYELINFSKLSSKKFFDFIHNFEGTNMTKSLWSKLIQCFYVNHNDIKQENKVQMKNCSKGIFSSLFKELGGNPIIKGIIKISGNSNNNGEDEILPNVIDSNWTTTHWVSKNEKNSYVTIDFNDRLVKINKYRLKIGDISGNFLFQNWTLKCQTEDNREIILDEVSSNNLVIQNHGEITRNINQKEQLLIRSVTLTMNGKEYKSQNSYMCLRNIEFFGSIKI